MSSNKNIDNESNNIINERENVNGGVDVNGRHDENGCVNQNDKLIYICTKRLEKLELLEKSLPEILERAIIDHKKEKLKLLHEKDKQNPAAVNARVKRYNERHKEEIAARKNAKQNKERIQKNNSVIEPLTGPKPKLVTENKQKIIIANMVTDKEFTVRFDL